MIGSDPQTALQGLTNAAGQITLSAPGLAGPLNVHASKAGWSAASVVAVNVENVTVRLQEFPPASPGNGSGAGGDEAPLPSYISGTVVDADKYTVFPMGSCKGQPSVASQCAPCSSDLDCLAGTACSDVRPPLVNGALTAAVPPDTSQKFCLLPCTSGQDCLPGFECRATGPDLSALQFRCTPRIGTPQVRCEGASQSIFGYPPASPGDGMADNQGKFTVRVNPGDTAILCKSGYIDKTTGEFVALAMGLTRRFFSIPGQSQSGAVVHVNVPLDRSLRVRMDRIPLGVAATGLRQMTAGLSLGAEGYLPTGQMQTYAQTDTLVLENQPSAALWGGENSDLRYELYGGLSQAYGASPNTTSQATHIDPRGLDRMAWLPPGSKQAVPSGAPLGPMACLASAGELRVAVGDRGAILHWTGGLFTPQPSPTAVDLTAVWLAPDGKGDGWIGCGRRTSAQDQARLAALATDGAADGRGDGRSHRRRRLVGGRSEPAHALERQRLEHRSRAVASGQPSKKQVGSRGPAQAGAVDLAEPGGDLVVGRRSRRPGARHPSCGAAWRSYAGGFGI
jgi:hypothetical protein